jgi:formamidopyrimidine-DNA glycosylase
VRARFFDDWMLKDSSPSTAARRRVVTRNEMADLAWRLGPDPLEAPSTYLMEALAARHAPIKALLLDQSFLAGVGNIYADEALHAAGIRPSRRGSDLDPDEIRALHRALQRILKRAVTAQRGGGDARFPLLAVRRHASRQLGASGSPKVGCPRCDRPLRYAKVGGRTSFYCASCQV